MQRVDGRQPENSAAGLDNQELYQACRRFGFDRSWRYKGNRHRHGRRKAAPVLKGTVQGLGDCGIRSASPGHGVRMQREAARGKVGGRTYEIQRLIGRSLRAVVDLAALGERTIWL